MNETDDPGRGPSETWPADAPRPEPPPSPWPLHRADERARDADAGRRLRRVALGLGAVALAGMAAVVGYAAFVARPAPGADTPAGAVREFYEALRADDCRRAAALLDPAGGRAQTEAQVCADTGRIRRDLGELERVHSATLDGPGMALVAARVRVAGETQEWLLRTRQVQGRWHLVAGGRCLPERRPPELPRRHLRAGTAAPEGSYNSNPPTSGPHDPRPAEFGTLYEVNPTVERLVHSMERGAVVLWHRGTDPAIKAQLEGEADLLFRRGYAGLIVTPYADLNAPIALTAWGVLLECAGVSPDDIARFVREHYGSGPQGRVACDAAGPRVLAPTCRR